ncbi:MAG: hypothetical protein PHW01_02060 [Patescibacteria group bacterium]|nr:hypothetical protein [Patescibacteria group bacterium]
MQNKSVAFKQKVVFLLVAVCAVGIGIFWLQTFNFRINSQKVSQNLGGLGEILEKGKEGMRLDSGLGSAKEQFQSEDSGSVLLRKEVGETQNKGNVEITLVNIVFKEKITWVYIFISNTGEERVLLRPSGESKIKIIQEGKEFSELEREKVVDYPLPDLVAAKSEVSGALHFSALDPGKPFTLSIMGVQSEGAREQSNFVFRIEGN